MRIVKLRVIRPFFDIVETTDRQVGQSFETTKERAEELIKNPNRIVEVYEVITREQITEDVKEEMIKQGGDPEVLETDVKEVVDNVIKDLEKLTYKDLQKMAKERGLKSVGVKKEELVNILSK